MANLAAVKEFLLNDSNELRNVVQELNSWDGCLDQFDVMENDEEFFNIHFDGNPMEAVRAAHYGDYNYTDDYVRFNGYGNLESINEYQLEREMDDAIDEIISELEGKWYHLSIDPELEELLEDEEEEDEEEENEEETCDECGEELHEDGECPECDA